MDKIKIIVVEDNIVYCEFVCNLLAREGFRTVQAFHLSTARKLLQQAADGDIVVSDLRLPDGNGIDLLRWMRKEGMTQPFIIMTDYAEVHTAVESMKLGSLDYIPKQLVEDKLVPLLRTILKERNIGRSRMPVFARDGSAFRKIMHRIRLVAPTDMSVLIFGENGTGKEHIAHHLHDKSKRSGKPFVAVDCGSLNKELAPSAFFGHVKGAFTGADSAKKGYFHEAEGGTLFLDEVGNLAPETQQMLLRAIQERRYRPVGDRTDRSFNVRIIAATNENLEKAVNEKRFRQDLLYRLHDFDITVPPLRDCQEDITWKIVDKKVAKRTAVQERVILPLRAQNYATFVPGKKSERTVFTMAKFTIPDGKCLVVELNEKNGGRHQSFVIENEDLVRANTINELQVR